MVAQALDRFGRIDTLVNNAGVFIAKPFTDYTLDDYAAITAVNLAGFFHITQRAIRQMVAQGCGHVVNVTTSLVDHADNRSPSALAALTKGGLDAVTRSLAIEYAASGVRVNAVAPGVIRTPMHVPATYDGVPTHPIGRSARSATSSTRSSTSSGPRSSPARRSTSTAAAPPATRPELTAGSFRPPSPDRGRARRSPARRRGRARRARRSA